MMKVYGVQLDIRWEDKPANHRAVRTLLERTRPEQGGLVVLPEMFSTGFSMNVEQVDDSASLADWHFLSDTARSFGIHCIGGLVTRASGGRALNQAVVFNPSGEEIGRYSKLHPFSPGKESQHYDAGGVITICSIGEFTVAPFICYDLRFPEAFRIATRRGATLLTVMANWPTTRVEHWVTLLRARAIENQAYVIGVNRCGNDPFLQYPGRTLIVDPRGTVLAGADASEGVIAARLNLPELLEYRQQLPFLADMRKDLLP